MKKKLLQWKLAALAAMTLFVNAATAQNVSRDGTWITLPEMPDDVVAAEAWIRPNAYQAAVIVDETMREVLESAPMEDSGQDGITVILPMPDGTFARFSSFESPVMHPDLAAQFPEIKTYVGQGIDDPAAVVRFDLTPQGFHAQILSPTGAVYIDPFSKGDAEHYASYYKSDLTNNHEFGCTVMPALPEELRRDQNTTRAIVKRREFALANAATGEYTTFHGGTVAAGQAAIVTAINRVSGVYEMDFAVRLILVANNSSIVYTNAATDPYTNNNGSTMLGQNQTTCDTVIGSANYDIGHVFSTGGGGIAQLSCVCNTGSKARGVTGLPSPTGDAFYIDFVAHEMGHQFGGNHSFNANTGCSGQRSSANAYEPGSGSTIMGYAGVCNATNNLQNFSDPYFLFDSIADMGAFINGRTCDTEVTLTNNTPVVDAGPNFNIPAQTPVILTAASSSDPDGDSLTFCWEERDLGAAVEGFSDNGTSPIWRSWTPTTSSSRIVPRLTNLLNNTVAKGEILPTTTRTINMRCTVRDNKAGGGGTSFDDMALSVTNTGAPFQVTSPNTNVQWSGVQTVTWNVSGTTSAPISCANVKIELSTDGGNTWPTVLVASTPNDGSESVTLPNITTTTARIRVFAVGNIFFDISNVNFRINPGVPNTPTNVQANPSSICVGQTSSLTATVGSGEVVDWYSVSCGTGLVGTGSPLVVSPTTTTTYFARARRTSDGAVSTHCGSAVVTVTPNPVAPTGASSDRSEFCASDAGNITLSATGGSGTTLRWFADSCGGTSIGTGNNLVIASPTQTTTYFARWENSCGNSTCASVAVTVLPQPEAPTGASSDRTGFCFDDDGSITLTATGGSGVTLNWYADSCGGTPIATGSPAVIDSPTTTTTYYASWTNGCGESGCASVTVEVDQGPDFNGDGFLSGDDFDEFNAAFELGDISADYNGDGFVNGDDFDEYVEDFDSGTC